MAKDQEGHTCPPSAPETTEDQKREQRARLIKALSRFKPRDANPLQFYNCVRELCIMHNCSIDEGLERAALTWPGLSMRQRELYDSQRHAELPIPVPRHLIYRAFQKESKGLWSLGRSSVGGGKQSTRYTLESYKPPPKPSRLRTQLNERRPKYDNLLDLPPKVAAMRVPPEPNRKFSRVSPASGRRIRSFTPPAVRRVRSIRHILSMASVDMKKSARMRNPGKCNRTKKTDAAETAGKLQPDKLASGVSKLSKKKAIKRKGVASKAKRLAKAEDLQTSHNWDEAIGCVRRRLMMHKPLKSRS
ncbi:uncharacterized protein LOC6524673 [Drosophila yakuba]|uniref:Uncharacterized protein n=1 Tax=Drosophila yakuba TaxID=7245 RepID=B4Q2P4_DROYA|nr:uncharacterized protein LOC6524673 [Drosophila yakuba]EDX01638.1 uncharacterized protein Dyak_GE17113 [Drosophila yakuba]